LDGSIGHRQTGHASRVRGGRGRGSGWRPRCGWDGYGSKAAGGTRPGARRCGSTRATSPSAGRAGRFRIRIRSIRPSTSPGKAGNWRLNGKRRSPQASAVRTGARSPRHRWERDPRILNPSPDGKRDPCGHRHTAGPHQACGSRCADPQPAAGRGQGGPVGSSVGTTTSCSATGSMRRMVPCPSSAPKVGPAI